MKWVKIHKRDSQKEEELKNNLFILRYCIENSFVMKKNLVVISIDFAKAYDSIKRDEMVNILIESKLNPKVSQSKTRTNEGYKIGSKGLSVECKE